MPWSLHDFQLSKDLTANFSEYHRWSEIQKTSWPFQACSWNCWSYKPQVWWDCCSRFFLALLASNWEYCMRLQDFIIDAQTIMQRWFTVYFLDIFSLGQECMASFNNGSIHQACLYVEGVGYAIISMLSFWITLTFQKSLHLS